MTTLAGVSDGRILIVSKEIESWYLAGLPLEDRRELRIPPFRTTDGVDKACFRRAIPKRWERVEFMLELLERYSLSQAVRSNKSFAYVVSRIEQRELVRG